MVKVLIVDDHAVVRAGLRSLIQSNENLTITGEASGGIEALELIKIQHPDVVVLDISMSDMDGIQVTKNIKMIDPDTRILILTVHEDAALLREAMKSGASGYILKHAAEKELLEAIRRILKGEMYVDPKMLPGLFSDDSDRSVSHQEFMEQLTEREVDILKLIVNGYTNRQIGEDLGISIRTVEGHRSNIYGKLGLHSRVELVRYARQHGMI